MRCGVSDTTEWDVIVVGGGPAGSSVAAYLAQQGFAVLLLDRAQFPRDKACGEFLTPQARTLLTELGAWDAVRDAGARPVNATVLIAPDGSEVRHKRTGGEPVGYALRRVALDTALLDHARQYGVTVREGVSVREVLRNEEGRACGILIQDEKGEKQQIFARLLIGADGSHSLIARQLNLVRPLKRLQRVAVITHWRNVSGITNTIEMRARGPIVCGIDFPGGSPPHSPNSGGSENVPPLTSVSHKNHAGSQYAMTGSPQNWGDGGASANVTFVVPTPIASQIAGRKRDFVLQTIESQFPDVVERLSGADCEPEIRTVGCFGHVCRPPVADGAMLVGDAATFIDPFTGEGIYFALRGASLAAEVATEALRADDLTRARLFAYARARRELTQRYLLCDIVQAVVRRPAMLSHVVRRLEAVPGLADRLLSILGDFRPPTDALHPAFLWRLLAPE